MPAIGVNPIPRVKDYSSTILPTTAKKLLRPMKWVYDRPLTTLVRQAHNYRADVPIKAGPATVVNTYIIPTIGIRVLSQTIQVVYLIRLPETMQPLSETSCHRYHPGDSNDRSVGRMA